MENIKEGLNEQPIKNTKQQIKHGMSKTRLYSIWRHMKDRCNNPNNNWYHLYGGKGIRVCDEWNNDFIAFKNWSMLNGYDENLSIDRIDGDKNYCPENCRWSTPLEQSNNTARNVFLSYQGKTMTVAQWERYLEYPRKLICNRLLNGWSVEAALSTPPINTEDRRNKNTGRFDGFDNKHIITQQNDC